ncbi:related to emopamil-binding protein [Rhynchosporium agropyri]|uniref:Related to emopamil-binding protein n=1 Tax=Rhynchosporium agropyri TaxID=914238 RepID=A0A1E1LCI9_9HELO|nr:related to emopamil-binding protein [Rhynchosporium agropyri]
MGLEDLPSHPYFPESLILSGGKYVANTWDVATLITIFFAGFAAIMSFTFMIAMNVNENLRKRDVGLVMWFIFWGPLSFLTALLILIDSPYRYPIQAFVSTGQFYGDILYYTTSLFDDLYRQQRHYRPEPYYFWFYFVFMNGAWIVIPLCCLFSSIKATAKSFAISQKVERTKKVQ